MTGIPVKVDGRGRVTLGSRFAHHLVLLKQLGEDRVQIELAEAVPAREVWLYKNKSALRKVRKGIAQAKAGKLTEGPDLRGGSKTADAIKD